MALKILQDEHEKIRKDLEKELVKDGDFLDEKIGENRLNECSVLCSHRISRACKKNYRMLWKQFLRIYHLK